MFHVPKDYGRDDIRNSHITNCNRFSAIPIINNDISTELEQKFQNFMELQMMLIS